MRFSDARHERSVRGVIWNCVDTTDEKRALEALHFAAGHDGLTGLPNRRSLFESFAAAADAGATCGLVLLGLDGLKAVNDRLGHSAGDEVVRRTAERLLQVAGAGAVVARLDGDEFAVLVTGGEREVGQAVATLGDRCVRAVREPLAVGGRTVGVTAGAGTALAVPDTDALQDRVRQLFQHADIALVAAKAGGGDRAVPFSRACSTPGTSAPSSRPTAHGPGPPAAARGLPAPGRPRRGVDRRGGATRPLGAPAPRGRCPRRSSCPWRRSPTPSSTSVGFVLDQALGAVSGFRAAAGGTSSSASTCPGTSSCSPTSPSSSPTPWPVTASTPRPCAWR